MLKAITFDFWDTLYKVPDNMGLSSRRIAAFIQTLHEIGFDPQEDALRQAFFDCWQYANHCQIECGLDITPRGHVEFILAQLHFNLNPVERQKVYDAYTSILVKSHPQLNDGVKETLPRLAEKYKLAVICNTGATPGIILREIMKNDDIFKLFDSVVFSDEVLWAKPNEKIFNYTLEQLHIQNIEAAHIGDNLSTDITGAKRAGMIAIWLDPHGETRAADYDYKVSSVIELLDLFGG